MSVYTVALLASGFALGWLLAGRRHWLRPVPGLSLRVSVIVPARDEAERLPRLLAALAHADPPPHEVLVVDDGSSDGTGDLARRAGATVLRVDPPAGWTGKAWACQQGAEAATGEVLVFLDADTEPAPGLVSAIATTAAARDALVSAQPRHRVERAYERWSAGPALVALLGAGTGGPTHRRWWRRAVAFGPALAVPASTYHRLGGHGAVRGGIAEDLALAATADRHGVPVHSYLGGDLIAYRMYPEGFGRLAEGWGKNLATGASGTPPLRLTATVVWVAAGLQAALSLLTARDVSALMWGLGAYALFAVQAGVLLHRVGRFGWATAAGYVVPLAGFVVLFLRSTLVTLRGGAVWWRGRRVALRS